MRKLKNVCNQTFVKIEFKRNGYCLQVEALSCCERSIQSGSYFNPKSLFSAVLNMYSFCLIYQTNIPLTLLLAIYQAKKHNFFLLLLLLLLLIPDLLLISGFLALQQSHAPSLCSCATASVHFKRAVTWSPTSATVTWRI